METESHFSVALGDVVEFEILLPVTLAWLCINENITYQCLVPTIM
jgi:hypothetical protein